MFTIADELPVTLRNTALEKDFPDLGSRLPSSMGRWCQRRDTNYLLTGRFSTMQTHNAASSLSRIVGPQTEYLCGLNAASNFVHMPAVPHPAADAHHESWWTMIEGYVCCVCVLVFFFFFVAVVGFGGHPCLAYLSPAYDNILII
jgi:hypothetical protein